MPSSTAAGPPSASLFSIRRVQVWGRSDQPLVRLCAWPFFASQQAMDALRQHCRAQLIEADPWPDPNRFSGAGPWLWPTKGLRMGQPRDRRRLRSLASAVAGRGPLILWTDRLDPWPGIEAQTWLPWQLCLSEAEIRRRLGDREAAGRLFRLTGGWPGAVQYLLDRRWQQQPGARTRLESDLFCRLRERVAEQLSEPEKQVVRMLTFIRSVSPEAWRVMFADQPALLSAFECLLRRHALLIPDSSGNVHLPRLLVAAWDAGGVSAGDASSRPPADHSRLDHFDLEQLELDLKGLRSSKVSALPLPVAASEVGRSPDQAKIRMDLFGPPRVFKARTDGSWQLVSWRLHRALHCVAYLALSPASGSTKDRLIEDLWPNRPRDVVNKNFHPTLSEARKALGGSGTLVHHQGTYGLSRDLTVQLDIDRFQSLITEAGQTAHDEPRLRLLEQAWKLYRGPLLEGVEDDWVLPLRDRFHDQYVQVLRQAGTLAMTLGRHTEAMDALRSLLLADPFDEPAHVALMEVYGHTGRRDLVRRQYIKLQERLKDLRVEPSAEAVDVYHRWMS